MDEIKLRPHHLLCIPRYYRGGYVAETMKKICSNIRKKSNTKIKVVKKTDDVCTGCLHLKKDFCNKRPKINKYILIQDEMVLKKLNVKENSVHKAKDIFNHSVNEITNEDLKEICNGCDFLESCLKWGPNKSFVKDIKCQQ